MIRRIRTRWQLARTSHNAAWVVLTAAAMLFPSLTGCEKGPPTFKELIGQNDDESETAPAPQPAPSQQPAQVTPKQAAPPPAPKKRSPQEILGEFHRTQPRDRTDDQLAEMAGMEDGLDQVKTLILNQSKVTDAGLRHLEKFDAVTVLELGMADITNDGLASIAKMKNLEELSLEGAPARGKMSNDPNVRFLDTGLAQIKTMPKLRSLRLSSASFTDKGLEEILKMKDLEALYLGDTAIGDENLAQLKGLENLRILDVSATRITDFGFEHLMDFKNLEWLDVSRNKDRIKGTGYKEARRRKGLRNLKHLSVADTKWGNDGMLGIKDTSTLEYLDLGDTLVNDQSLQAVKSNKKLQKIYLHRNGGITSNGMANLAPLVELNTIYLDNVRGMTDDGLKYFTRLKKLERLVLTETRCTEGGAMTLKRMLPDVKIELKRGQPPL